LKLTIKILHHARSAQIWFVAFQRYAGNLKAYLTKILAKELQEMEDTFLIVRTVNDTRPITVSYALSEYAGEANAVLNALIGFGLNHRKNVKSSMQQVSLRT
jgi:DNA-binding HxlR family transcriptional regulator